MLSVLIINSEIYDRYSRYAYFFNYFEDHKDVAVCFWNKSGVSASDIDAMIPQLMDIVKNAPQWNAYIVDSPYDSMAYIQRDFEQKTQYSINPYERAYDPEYDIETDPLLKLVYFLGGRGVEQLPYIERFQFRAIRPNNIFLITPRIFEDLEMQQSFLDWEIKRNTPNYLNDPSAILSDNDDRVLQYSSFWERYHYPPNCRFLVYNMPNERNQSYDDAWFTLWLSVVSLMLNTFESAELGPYKLYLVNTLISDEGFAQFLNKFYTMLLDAKDAVDKDIDNEVKAIKEERSDTSSDDVSDVAPVYVYFPDVNLDNLYATREDFGLTKDHPEEDETIWHEQMKNSKATESKLFKAIERGKNEAVESMTKTFLIDLPSLKRRQITQYNAEDMIESMNEKEIEMIELDTGYRASRSVFIRQQRMASEKVQSFLRKRIRRTPALITVAVTMLVYFAGFVPYLIASAKRGLSGFLLALLISLGSAAIVGASGYLALRWLYWRLKRQIDDYNDVMQDNIQSVTDGAAIQSEYLSDLLDYMEKYQLVTNARVDRQRIERLNMLNLSSQRFENALNQCSAIARLRHLTLARLQEASITETLSPDPNVPIYLYEDVEGIMMPLNHSRNALNVPFPFVNGMELTEQQLYECRCYNQPAVSEEAADQTDTDGRDDA